MLFIIALAFQIIPIKSQIIDNIIRLAPNPYRYNHISFNSEGDMVIDIESYPLENNRKFYGIKKNGREFFTDSNGIKTYFHSMELYLTGRVEGESCFIKVQSTDSKIFGKELLFGVSKSESNTYKIEIYNLSDSSVINYMTNNYFDELITNVFSLIPDPLNNEAQFNYFITYVATPDKGKNYYLYTKKLSVFINSNTNKGINLELLDNVDAITQKIISCFFTDNYFYICFYTKKDSKLTIWVYDPLKDTEKGNEIFTFKEKYERRFYKGIHLKGEIGFFAYFKDQGNIPTFSLYIIDSSKDAKIYKSYGDMQATQGTFYNIEMLNDLVKLNNNTVCFFSSNPEKTGLYVLVFNLYDDDNYMNIRYFYINIWQYNRIKFFCELRLSLFNNFIIMTFSNCDQDICNESQTNGYDHFSSLIFFNDPTIYDNNFDVIEYIYPDNKNITNEISIDFKKYLVIENNLFGYVFKGIKIISFPNEINLVTNEALLTNGENVTLKFKSNSIYPKNDYNIEFAFIITEPNYETTNNYMIYIDETKGNNKKQEKNYFQKYDYIGKDLDFKMTISKNLTTACISNDCSLCYEEKKEICVTCKYNFSYIPENKTKICFEKEKIPTTIPFIESEKIEQAQTAIPIVESEKIEQIPTTLQDIEEIPSTTPKETQFTENNVLTTETLSSSNIEITTDKIEITDIKTNSLSCADDILSGNCYIKLSNDQLNATYNYIKSLIKANTSKIITTENVIFQISPLSEQKGNDNPNISSIDLGECEKILKNNSNLTDEDDLILYKIDIKNEDSSITYVQYEIYNPKTLQMISLEYCKDLSIIVNIPVNLDENTQSIYDSLTKSGYNLFDLEDDFYNDICSTYTSENGTDLTLADRKRIIYDNSGDITMCQEGCSFEFYNLTTKKSQCDCEVQTDATVTNIDEINFENTNLAKEFFNTLNNSNFRVLKCYKLVFSKKGQKNNIGSYIMSVFCLIIIILLLIYIIKENAKIKKFIQKILKRKLETSQKKGENESKLNNSLKIFGKDKIVDNFNSKEDKETKKNRSKKFKKEKKEKKNKKKKRSKNKDDFPPKRKQLQLSSKNLFDKKSKANDSIKTSKIMIDSKKERIKTINIINIKNVENKEKDNKEIIKIKNMEEYLKDNKMKNINDQQMNDLEYEIALIIDKRTYFQYYFSLIKKKHLLLFAFCPNHDYNSRAIKISLLILSFSLYFTVNGFFFSDETMNKINKDYGKYDILFQIPQIMYSTLISAVINMILRQLSLSEKQILIIKNENNYINAKKKSKSIRKCLKIKLGIFFTLSLILMLFFWYFISCFCAVYKNTQKILIIDTLISFIISMIYPFGLNLLPGFFRIPSLRTKDKDKKYLYILSGYVALI